MITFSNNVSWLGSSLSNYNQHQYNDNISLKDVTNWELIKKLALGQSVACSIKINNEQEILPLFLILKTNMASSQTQTQTYTAKGTTVLNDGKIAGVIMIYNFSKIILSSGIQQVIEKLTCHVYIHNWGIV